MKKSLPTGALWKFAALCLFMIVLYALTRDLEITLIELRDRVGGYPLYIGFVAFAGLYALVSVVPIAGRDVFKIVGALLWGWWLSTLFVFAGEMLAALTAFLLAKVLGKDLMDQLFGNKLKSSYERLNRAGFRNVVLLRILPITPYRFFNFAAGVTDLNLATYLAGSAVGIFVRTLIFQGLFALFAEEMIARNVSISQIVVFSLGLSMVMVLAWVFFSHRKRSDSKPEQSPS